MNRSSVSPTSATSLTDPTSLSYIRCNSFNFQAISSTEIINRKHELDEGPVPFPTVAKPVQVAYCNQNNNEDDERCISGSNSNMTSAERIIQKNSDQLSPILAKPMQVSPAFFDAQDDSNQPVKNIKQKERKSIFFRVLIFIMGKFGMFILSIVYAIIGAFLFKLLAQSAAIGNCQQAQMESRSNMTQTAIDIFSYLAYNVTYSPDVTNLLIQKGLEANVTIGDGPDKYNPTVERLLRKLRRSVLLNKFNGNYNNGYCENMDIWNFWNAFLFTVSVITTIGYGHITPKSAEAQLVLFCYALLGIPLFLLSLTRFSGVLADMFIFLYRYVICCPCEFVSAHRSTKPTEPDAEEGADPDSHKMDSALDSDPFDTTAGVKKAIYDDKDSDVLSAVVEDDYEDEDDEELEDDTHKIPMVFIFGILVLFLCAGGLLFNLLEYDEKENNRWTFAASVYFSTISFLTIGFGDLTPGLYYLQNDNYTLAVRNLICAIIYVFFGMSVAGMSISLAQEGATDSIISFLKKMKIIKDSQEDEEKSCEIIEIINYHEDGAINGTTEDNRDQ